MSLNMTPPSTRQRHNQTPLTLLDTRSSGDSSLALIYEYSGDSKLSFVCKGFQEVGDRAMSNLIYSHLNKGLCLKLRLLRNIRPLKVGCFADPRDYTTKVRQVLQSGLSKQERFSEETIFWGKIYSETGGMTTSTTAILSGLCYKPKG